MKTLKLDEVEMKARIMSSILTPMVNILEVQRGFLEHRDACKEQSMFDYLNEEEDLVVNILTQLTESATAIVESLFNTEKEKTKRLIRLIELEENIAFSFDGVVYEICVMDDDDPKQETKCFPYHVVEVGALSFPVEVEE